MPTQTPTRTYTHLSGPQHQETPLFVYMIEKHTSHWWASEECAPNCIGWAPDLEHGVFLDHGEATMFAAKLNEAHRKWMIESRERFLAEDVVFWSKEQQSYEILSAQGLWDATLNFLKPLDESKIKDIYRASDKGLPVRLFNDTEGIQS